MEGKYQIIGLFVVLLISFVSAQSDCSVSGSWYNSTSASIGDLTSETDITLDFSQKSSDDSTNTTAGDATITTELDFNGCKCSIDSSGPYNYSSISLVVSFTNLTCSNNKTSGNCTGVDCSCTTAAETFDFPIATWSSDCSSFTVSAILGGYQFDKQGSDWWIWAIVIGAITIVVIVVIIVIAVAGFMFYKKRMQYSSYN